MQYSEQKFNSVDFKSVNLFLFMYNKMFKNFPSKALQSLKFSGIEINIS